MDCPEIVIHVDRPTAALIVQLSLKLEIPVSELLTQIFASGLAEHIQKN